MHFEDPLEIGVKQWNTNWCVIFSNQLLHEPLLFIILHHFDLRSPLPLLPPPSLMASIKKCNALWTLTRRSSMHLALFCHLTLQLLTMTPYVPSPHSTPFAPPPLRPHLRHALAFALALTPYTLSFAISGVGGCNHWRIETFFTYDFYKRLGPFACPSICLYLLELSLLELQLLEPHLIDLSLLNLHDLDLNLFEFHLLGPRLLDPIIYLVHSSTWSTFLLGALIYWIHSSTRCTH